MTRQQRIEAYLAEYEQLSPEEQRLHNSVVIAWIVQRLRKMAAARMIDSSEYTMSS